MSMSKAKAENRPLPKRFYTEVAVAPVNGGWGVYLDGRALKTPAKNPLSAPVETLARAMADEWAAQKAVVDPFTMPLTRLAHVAIDRMGETRDAAATEVAKYATTDLLCHRAEDGTLAARQAELWDGWLDWAETALDAPLKRAGTLLALEQPQSSLDALERRAAALDDWRLTGLVSAVSILGSAVLGFALLEGEGTGEDLLAASRLEEDHQIARWGEDADAAQAAANRRRDLLAIEAMFRMLDAAEG